MIRVVIAEDQALVRAGFTVLIDSAPDMEVVGQAGNGAEATELARRHRPDVVVMDVLMPVMNGIDATRAITTAEETAGTRVLILTTFDLDEHVYAALQVGASGFLIKDTPPEELLAGIRVLAAGDALLSPGVTRRLIKAFADRPHPATTRSSALVQSLTPREREVLVEVATGRSNAEIGQRLAISPGTAKTHVSRVLAKLEARDRAQLVMIAYDTGVVTPR